MKKLAIFDLDGTLINSIADLATATNQALLQLHHPQHPLEKYPHFVGNGINKLFERALPEGQKTEENIQKVRELFIPYYNDHCMDLTRPYEGIPEMLIALSKRGLQLAVATNKYQQATEIIVPRFFPHTQWLAVTGTTAGGPRKPDPANINKIIKQAGVSNDEVLYIGDSDVDMQTAHNAKVDGIGCAWGFRGRKELEAYHPLAVIDTPDELLKYI